eukprot:4777142-Alexandrium_andersonii.AAC.1
MLPVPLAAGDRSHSWECCRSIEHSEQKSCRLDRPPERWLATVRTIRATPWRSQQARAKGPRP